MRKTGHDAAGASAALVVMAQVGLGDELLHHHIEHGPGGKESSQGISGSTVPAARTVSRAAMGSTAPEAAR